MKNEERQIAQGLSHDESTSKNAICNKTLVERAGGPKIAMKLGFSSNKLIFQRLFGKTRLSLAKML